MSRPYQTEGVGPLVWHVEYVDSPTNGANPRTWAWLRGRETIGVLYYLEPTGSVSNFRAPMAVASNVGVGLKVGDTLVIEDPDGSRGSMLVKGIRREISGPAEGRIVGNVPDQQSVAIRKSFS